MTGFYALLHKDLTLERRSGGVVIELCVLSLLVLVVLLIAYGPEAGGRPASTAGALWVALILSGLPGASLAIAAEHENDCLKGLRLSPLEPATIYAAKVTAVALSMVISQAATLLLLVLFFNLQFESNLLRLVPILLLGMLGLSALSTLLGTITSRLRAGEMLLALLAAPLYVPELIAGVKASTIVLAGGSLAAVVLPLKILAACDLLFVTCGYLLFEYLVG
jgi:heme exporter protein B